MAAPAKFKAKAMPFGLGRQRTGQPIGKSLKTPPGFLERTQNEKRRFRFASKSKPCSFDFGWHIPVPMSTSKNQGFFEGPY
jgi:hypothetical protein